MRVFVVALWAMIFYSNPIGLYKVQSSAILCYGGLGGSMVHLHSINVPKRYLSNSISGRHSIKMPIYIEAARFDSFPLNHQVLSTAYRPPQFQTRRWYAPWFLIAFL